MANDFPPIKASGPYVYVPVHESRVDAVIRFLATDRTTDSGLEPDLERTVERLYRESDEPFRELLGFLASRADEPVSTEEVAEELALSRGTASLAGMLGAFGRRTANRYKGFWPFEKSYNPVEDDTELRMPREVAKVLRALDLD